MYQIGKVFKRNKKLIYITSGQYESNGRISNAWTWKEVQADGTLSEKTQSGYGDNSEPIKARIKITVELE